MHGILVRYAKMDVTYDDQLHIWDVGRGALKSSERKVGTFARLFLALITGIGCEVIRLLAPKGQTVFLSSRTHSRAKSVASAKNDTIRAEGVLGIVHPAPCPANSTLNKSLRLGVILSVSSEVGSRTSQKRGGR
uniref:Uncharacterized protein n=1 Tax=Moniliophthora roreri TaxID=221103 RepID=A0A0W0FBM9_MONRR